MGCKLEAVDQIGQIAGQIVEVEILSLVEGDIDAWEIVAGLGHIQVGLVVA